MSFNDIEDLAVDENFDIFISHRGDIATVSGREAFEQRVRIYVTARVRPLIGEPDASKETIRELARSYAARVVSDADEIESIASFRAEFSDEQVGRLEVTIVYNTGEELTFEVE